MPDLVVRNAAVLAMDDSVASEDLDSAVANADLRIRDGQLLEIGTVVAQAEDIEFDATGLLALPGFVQGHVHYCQTLFRGLADDLSLIDWLQERIWPMEAAHDADTTRLSAQLSVTELLRGGTTTTQVMESVHHAEVSFAVARDSRMLTILGNCLMDVAGPGVPPDWVTTRSEAMEMVADLHLEFDGLAGRLHYAISPRFILSCSDELSREAADYATAHDLRIHTHADEHLDEVGLVRQQTGKEYILALESLGLLTARTTLAHCVHTSTAERDALQAAGSTIAHCPTTNLKLGSGLAPIADYQARGIPISLGADGAACNNRLSALAEIRQAALVAAAQTGPGHWPADRALRAATIGGAEALGVADEVGSLQVGKRADLVLMRQPDPECKPTHRELVSHIVYTAETEDIRHVLVGGEWCVRDGVSTTQDTDRLSSEQRQQLPALLSRAGLSR
ncbi:MAG: amidohydrolase family protein [Planctomycetota bacterium]|nr:amidohydrolase family protein [Planctomycetota bacterium]